MKDDNGITRRELFVGAGIVGAGLGPFTPLMAQAVGSRSTSYGQLSMAVEIDGVLAGLATAVQGGGPIAEYVPPPIAPANKMQGARVVLRGPEPVTVRFRSMPGAKFPDWFAARDLVPRNVAIILFDKLRGTELYRLNMANARIVAVRLPAVDSSVNLRATVFECEVTFLADSSMHIPAAKGAPVVRPPTEERTAAVAGFRFWFEGLDPLSSAIIRVGSVALQANPPVPTWTLTPLKFSVLFNAAEAFYAWFNDALRHVPAYRNGFLQFQDANANVLGTVELVNCIPSAVSPPFNGAAAIDAPVAVDVEVGYADAVLKLGGLIG